MPLLPKGNSLDYNPDAMISASKKLKSIALERMKNPVTDPDKATLSALQAEKSLGETFDKIDEMTIQYQSIVLRLANLLAGRSGAGRKLTGGKGSRASDISSLSSKTVSSAQSEFNKLKKFIMSRENPRYSKTVRPTDRNSVATPSTPSTRTPSTRSSESGFASIYPYDEPSTRTPSTRSSESGYNTIYPDDDFDPDFDDEPSIPTLSSFSDASRFNPYIADEPEGAREKLGVNFNSLIFPLIQLTRRIDIIVNSRIKPAIKSLKQNQIDKLVKLFELVRTSYDTIMRPTGAKRWMEGVEETILEQNQFGDQIIATWNTERKSLLLDLTVVINSWKQNTASGQQAVLNQQVERDFQDVGTRLGRKAEILRSTPDEPVDVSVWNQMRDLEYGQTAPNTLDGAGRKRRGRPRKTGSMNLIGCGNNFYGEKINESSDIPTIWSGALKSCPTKYLL